MNATEFCQLVENRLGWEPPQGLPSWNRYRVAAAQVNTKVASNPSLFTWENLSLAVELLVREKQSRSPVGVFAHVDRALDLALDPEEDLDEEIRKVVAYETLLGDPAGWASRLTRAQGTFRREALTEWKEAVR